VESDVVCTLIGGEWCNVDADWWSDVMLMLIGGK